MDRTSLSWSEDAIELSPGELFLENSKQQRYDLEFSRRVSYVNNDQQIHELISAAFKSYPGAAALALPAVTPGDGLSVEQAIAARRSVRRFTAEPLAMVEVARLLQWGNGLTGQIGPSQHGLMQPVRAAPSGGALYPVELYVCAANVAQLAPGLYHYRVDTHALERLRAGELAPALAEATSDHRLFGQAALTIMVTLMFSRTRFKYGERGYRFALFEAGHVAQNLLLECASLGLAAVPIGGFIDDEINALLDVDGVDEACVYLVAIGRPEPSLIEPSTAASGSLIDTLLRSAWE